MDARWKFLAFVAFCVALFCWWNWFYIGCLACLLIVLTVAAKVSPLDLVRSVWGILLMLVIVSFLNIFVIQEGNAIFEWWIFRFTDVGLERALYYSARLVLLLMAGALLLATTAPMQLTEGIAKLLSPLQKIGIPISQLAMVLSLAIRFVPVIASEASSIKTAQALRGAHFSHGTLSQRISALVALVLPIVVGVVRHAENLSFALLSKNYVPGAKRTSWDYEGFLSRKRD